MLPGPVLLKIKRYHHYRIWNKFVFSWEHTETQNKNMDKELLRNHPLDSFYFSGRDEPVCKEQVTHVYYKPWNLQWRFGKFTKNYAKVFLHCFIVPTFTLFQNVIIYNFDKTFSIKHPLFTLNLLEFFSQILLRIGFSPVPVVLYFSKSNMGSVLLEQVTMLSSVIIVMIIV